MRLSSRDRRFIERQAKPKLYLDDLSGMRVFAMGGARSSSSVRNAVSRKTKLPERVLLKF